MSEFIQIYDNILSKDLCIDIINKFENNNTKERGRVIGGIHTNIKNTYDLNMNPDLTPEFTENYNIISSKLNFYTQEYFKNISQHYNSINNLYFEPYHLIMKYNKNEGKYVFHNDQTTKNNGKTRILTYLFYLNTVEEGGETEFIDGTKIKPEAGKLLIFPATWSFIHKGNMPFSNDKYICTGWLYNK
tara:strand:+ start:149 stop:712 length:564 start_codon:yes stop_codon:yes gene_type:complete